MRYELTCQVKCYNCKARDKEDDGMKVLKITIEADSQLAARNKLEKERPLCDKCLAAGTPSRVNLEDILNIEPIPSFPA